MALYAELVNIRKSSCLWESKSA